MSSNVSNLNTIIREWKEKLLEKLEWREESLCRAKEALETCNKYDIKVGWIDKEIEWQEERLRRAKEALETHIKYEKEIEDARKKTEGSRTETPK